MSITFAAMNNQYVGDLRKMYSVTAVAFANGIKARFGDFKVCAESQGEVDVPDFVAVHCTAKNLHALEQLDSREVPYLKFVGETKTPWRHDLGKIYHDFTTRKKSTIDRALSMFLSVAIHED
ncbi:uncharacterized protein TERG_12592 [Trichophyton rubrum CBS 118892]|uniref:Uncharacterized protein n=1 Tax=Trichophyton rubrum (strain ATCC MYA-4607 / CBS 118892) TaxID=559305 RepID=A0A080WJC6_TRIRC|nr:uncharacterized protein TERG_12592 [Trichophyton rubrum CBS 118892]KFL62831.1 hypothetical protein TERG_12592 [Trichophyton rubrum CBS 118892]